MYFLSFINKELILFTSVYVVIVLVINSIWLHPKGLAPWKEPIIEFFWQCWGVRLRIIYVIVTFIISYHLFELFFKLRDQIFSDITILTDDKIRNLALAFLGTISGIGALFGVYLAILRSDENKRQNDVAEQGIITDRINKATAGLGKSDAEGNPVIEVRLGALYALERIAQDSLRDHVQIMEILCAYVRYNSPREDPVVDEEADTATEDETKPFSLFHNNKKSFAKLVLFEEDDKPDPPREDIQAVLTIIGRRHKWPDGEKYLKKEQKDGYQIDLRHCDLHSAQLPYANLTNAMLNETNMDNADLFLANMENTKTEFAFAQKGSFAACENITQKQLNQMFLGKVVSIPYGLEHPQKHSEYDKSYPTFDDFMRAYKKWRPQYRLQKLSDYARKNAQLRKN